MTKDDACWIPLKSHNKTFLAGTTLNSHMHLVSAYDSCDSCDSCDNCDMGLLTKSVGGE